MTRKNVIDWLSDCIDDNLRVVRILPWAIGGLGVLMIIKHTNCFVQFRSARKIPSVLIKENSTLRGYVTNCYNDSIYIWHAPLRQRVLRLNTKPPTDLQKENSLIKVKFSGVSSHNGLEEWLKNNLLNQSISFKMLHYDNHTDAIESIVYLKKRGIVYSSINVNMLLISIGKGSLSDSIRGFKDIDSYTKFVTEMSRRELKAQKKGMGSWQGTIYVSWWRKMLSFVKK